MYKKCIQIYQKKKKESFKIMIQRCCSLNSISKRESVAFGLILLAGKKNQERENG